MERYRVGIVGLTGIAADGTAAGPIAAFGDVMPHSHAAAYAMLSECEVVAACDLVPERCDEFRARWADTWPEVATYGDHRQMLARERLDILSVATSDHRHADIVVDAVAAGVRGIFCEKPIATSLTDADRMIAAVEGAGVAMLVNHSRRWFPEFQQAREIVRSGELGTLSRIVACHGGPRAMLFRNGTHMIDTINFFAESEPLWVIAELDPGHEQYGLAYAGDGGRDPATDPGATAWIHYRNGVSALYCGSKRTAVPFEVDLLCERGRIRLSPGSAQMETPGPRGAPLVQRLSAPQYRYSDTVAAIRELIGMMRGGVVGQSPPCDARQALEIILAILRSQHLGNVRVDLPL